MNTEGEHELNIKSARTKVSVTWTSGKPQWGTQDGKRIAAIKTKMPKIGEMALG